MKCANQLKRSIVLSLLNSSYLLSVILEFAQEDTIPLLEVKKKPVSPHWAFHRCSRPREGLLTSPRQRTAELTIPTVTKEPTRLTESDIARIDNLLAFQYWKIPENWNPKHLDENNGIYWLRTYLYKPTPEVQKAWLISAKVGHENPRYSHPLEEMPIILRMLDCYNRRQAGDKIEIIHLINFFFDRLSDMDLHRSSAIAKVMQDALIVNFIAALATLTEVSERQSTRVSSLSTEIQQIVVGRMTAFRRCASSSGRNDILELVQVFEGLGKRNTQSDSE